MLQTSTGREYGGAESREHSVETSVVLPAPCTPFSPMMKGFVGGVGVWWERCRRMKGMQWGDLSSMISGRGAALGSVEEGELMGAEVDILVVGETH